jgi:hypothetical protein
MNKKIFLLISLALLSSCAQLPTSHDGAKDLVLQKVRPALEKIFDQENPINPPEWSTYPIVQKLPGNPFVPRQTIRSFFTYNSDGRLLLAPGDYTFPVMTYCMKSSAASPAGHIYSLSQLTGKRAKIIRDLNLLAPAKYFSDEIQMVSWSLQNGLSYEELGKLGQEMVDSVIPHYKVDLRESILNQIEKKWNQISDSSLGTLPSFSESISTLEDNLGEIGKRIQEMRDYRDRLGEVGYDYARLSELIDTSSRSEASGDTAWSKISNNVYARFVTNGSFGEIGYVQVRVLASSLGREINSVSNKLEIFDIATLMTNPNDKSIQPLSFSPLYGFGGTITLTPALSRHPLAGALLLAAVLNAKDVDWDAFFDLQDLLQDLNDRDFQKEIERGMEALRKEHDILEKPLKEAGIISEKTKDTSKNKNGRVRNYEKEGGEKQRQKDFDKIEGEYSKAKDGTEKKVLPDGTSVVKRPDEDTIEVQAPKGDPRYPFKGTKVKVRYP